MAVYRLAKVASELNRSTSAIAEFLQEKGHDVQARPTTKITEEMYSSQARVQYHMKPPKPRETRV